MKAIVTVTGKDAVGIIAGVCQELAGLGVNILDINQTVMDGFFAMNMLVYLSTTEKSYELVRDFQRHASDLRGTLCSDKMKSCRRWT